MFYVKFEKIYLWRLTSFIYFEPKLSFLETEYTTFLKDLFVFILPSLIHISHPIILKHLIQQPFMGAPRYPSGPRPGGVRMPQGIGNDFNGVSQYLEMIKNGFGFMMLFCKKKI